MLSNDRIPGIIYGWHVVGSITNLGDQVKLHKVGLKSVLFLLLNTFTAAVITLVAALSLGLGKGFQYTVEATEAKEVPTAVEAIVGLFPKNLINEWGSNTVVPILLFGLVVADYILVKAKVFDEAMAALSAEGYIVG